MGNDFPLSARAILLDADDTIFDFGRCERLALEAVCLERELRFDEQTLERYRAINERLWEDLARGTVGTDVIRVRRFELFLNVPEPEAKVIGDRYLDLLSEQSVFLPGARDALAALRERFPLALVTNGIGATQRGRLNRSGIAEVFTAVIISEEVGSAKPHPLPFTAALSALGERPQDAVMVGDSPQNDIAGAQALGMSAVWINSSGAPYPLEPPPTLTLRTLSELPGMLHKDEGGRS